MKNRYNSFGRCGKRALFLSTLTAAAALTLTSCADTSALPDTPPVHESTTASSSVQTQKPQTGTSASVEKPDAVSPDMTEQIITVTENEIPFDTHYIYDENVYDDERIVLREGKNGVSVSTYRVFYENGVEVVWEIKNGVLNKDVYLTAFSITGYTGGGKKMIADYEADGRSNLLDAPRQYGLSQTHKHLPEMKVICGMDNLPCFCPIVSDYDRGMEVTVPLFSKDVKGGIGAIKDLYCKIYSGDIVKYVESSDESGFLSANNMRGKDGMEISVYGNEDRILLVSRFDNLGKGASGAAIQNMNILLGCDQKSGLIL